MATYIDFHCDTLSKAAMDRRQDICCVPDYMIDVERLQKAGCLAQFFAIYMPTIEELTGENSPYKELAEGERDEVYIKECRSILGQTIQRMPNHIALATNYQELLTCKAAGKIAGFLTLEDGRAVKGSMEWLEQLYQEGIRLISLTWNFHNCFGAPNSKDPKAMAEGLTDFGKEAVVRMQELGMLVDVSHLSDGGFWDVAKLSKKPFVASHSNCRSLNPHPRSMTDEMIRALAEAGGVMGVNFYSKFLNQDVECMMSKVSDIAAQLRHMIQVGGLECAAFGTDFDGIDCQLEIDHCGKMEQLFTALEAYGFTAKEIEYITYKNAMGVIKEGIG